MTYGFRHQAWDLKAPGIKLWHSLRVRVRMQFEPRGFWVGVFWRKGGSGSGWSIWHVYLCLVPMLTFHFCWVKGDVPR